MADSPAGSVTPAPGLHAVRRPGWLNGRFVAAIIAIAAVVGGLAGSAAAMSAKTRPKPPYVTVLCRKDQHMITKTGIDIRNNNFLGEPECLTNFNDDPGFVISKSGAHSPWAAFPNAFAGCEISVCSPRSRMPIRDSSIERLSTTWHFVPARRWKGNAAYDIWLNPTYRTSGEDTGAEIMLWLDSGQLAAPIGAPAVKIDGTRWWLSIWTVHHGRVTWQYVRFWRQRPTRSVTNLNLLPFLASAQRHDHIIRSSWWLTGVEAGYELWSGGVGTDTQLFAVTLTPKPARPAIKNRPAPKPKPTPAPTLPSAPPPSPIPSTASPTL
jgi:hypothetical protein